MGSPRSRREKFEKILSFNKGLAVDFRPTGATRAGLSGMLPPARDRKNRRHSSACDPREVFVNLTKRLRVEPGSKVTLATLDPGFQGKHGTEAEARAELQSSLARITELQRKLYASRSHCLLIVLQGIDAAGKDGVCWHVMSAMDPQGVNVVGFKQPTKEELDHDFLWRVHPHAPALGRVAIFNRSHYEDVFVARVHKLVPKEVWKRRFQFINDWEKLIASENNTTILKFFFLYISKEEQLARFKDHLDDPARQWKISNSDYSERELWDDDIDAFEAALSNCSTDYAPWFVIPSNHKGFRNLAVSRIIADALEGMKLDMPKPTVDLKEIRRLYHQDVEAEGERPRTKDQGRTQSASRRQEVDGYRATSKPQACRWQKTLRHAVSSKAFAFVSAAAQS